MDKVIVIVVLGILLGVIRYFKEQKGKKIISGGELLVEAIKSKQYQKVCMPNDYAEYTGELEENDTNEYIAFITPDILKLIK